MAPAGRGGDARGGRDGDTRSGRGPHGGGATRNAGGDPRGGDDPRGAAARAGAVRLDVALVQRGLCPSRERAQAAIRAGLVQVQGVTVRRPAHPVHADAAIAVLGDPIGYVSRGGLKLAAALDHFGLDPAGRVCLDAGASTGGFTHVLLARGARRVYAVDVGSGQLHPSLRADPRVVSLEQTDLRQLDALPPADAAGPASAAPPPSGAMSAAPPDPPVTLVTCDVSFISLTLVLPHLARLAPGADLLLLVKPQFEVGRGAVGKGGLVRDPRLRRRAAERVQAAATALGLRAAGGPWPSPVAGGDGNVELWLWVVPPPHRRDGRRVAE